MEIDCHSMCRREVDGGELDVYRDAGSFLSRFLKLTFLHDCGLFLTITISLFSVPFPALNTYFPQNSKSLSFLRLPHIPVILSSLLPINLFLIFQDLIRRKHDCRWYIPDHCNLRSSLSSLSSLSHHSRQPRSLSKSNRNQPSVLQQRLFHSNPLRPWWICYSDNHRLRVLEIPSKPSAFL